MPLSLVYRNKES